MGHLWILPLGMEKMPVSFEDAYSSAQKAATHGVWAYLSDAERLRAIRDHMYRMDAQEALARMETPQPISRRVPPRNI